MKTYAVKEGEIERKWYLVDAEGKVLGRLASQIASLLRGKTKPIYSPHLDTGDYVVVVNAEKVVLTGAKRQQKQYFRYTGYPGGAKFTPVRRLLRDKPQAVLKHAVKGMLPHNALGRRMFKKLFVYVGPEHPHIAQKPEPLELPEARMMPAHERR